MSNMSQYGNDPDLAGKDPDVDDKDPDIDDEETETTEVAGEDVDLGNAVDIGNPAYVGVDEIYQNSAEVTNRPFVSEDEQEIHDAARASEEANAQPSRLAGSVEG